MVELETGTRTAIPRDEIEIIGQAQQNNKNIKPLQDNTPEKNIPEEPVPENLYS